MLGPKIQWEIVIKLLNETCNVKVHHGLKTTAVYGCGLNYRLLGQYSYLICKLFLALLKIFTAFQPFASLQNLGDKISPFITGEIFQRTTKKSACTSLVPRLPRTGAIIQRKNHQILTNLNSRKITQQPLHWILSIYKTISLVQARSFFFFFFQKNIRNILFFVWKLNCYM